MLPTTPNILKAYHHWASGEFQLKMDCSLQVIFPAHLKKGISFPESNPSLSAINVSFSNSEIAFLANNFQLPEAFLNYLQRFKFQHTTKVFPIQEDWPEAILSLKASSIDFLLLAESLETWAASFFPKIGSEVLVVRWSFKP